MPRVPDLNIDPRDVKYTDVLNANEEDVEISNEVNSGDAWYGDFIHTPKKKSQSDVVTTSFEAIEGNLIDMMDNQIGKNQLVANKYMVYAGAGLLLIFIAIGIYKLLK